MHDLEIELREPEQLASLSTSEVVPLSLVLEVLMVGDHRELWKAFEVMMSVFEHSNNSHELLIIDLVVAFRCAHHL